MTNVAERKPIHTGGVLVELALWDDEGAEEWWKQFGEKTKFTFRHKQFGKGGQRLFCQLKQAIKERDADVVKNVLPKMKELCQPNYDDLSPREKWSYIAPAMPGDWGLVGRNRKEWRKRLQDLPQGGFWKQCADSIRISMILKK